MLVKYTNNAYVQRHYPCFSGARLFRAPSRNEAAALSLNQGLWELQDVRWRAGPLLICPDREFTIALPNSYNLFLASWWTLSVVVRWDSWRKVLTFHCALTRCAEVISWGDTATEGAPHTQAAVLHVQDNQVKASSSRVYSHKGFFFGAEHIFFPFTSLPVHAPTCSLWRFLQYARACGPLVVWISLTRF